MQMVGRFSIALLFAVSSGCARPSTGAAKTVAIQDRPSITIHVEGECDEAPFDLDTAVIRRGWRSDESESSARTASLTAEVRWSLSRLPIQNAIVGLFADSVSSELRRGFANLADHNGRATIASVPPGTYWLRVRSIGIRDVEGYVTLRPSAQDTIEVYVPAFGFCHMPDSALISKPRSLEEALTTVVVREISNRKQDILADATPWYWSFQFNRISSKASLDLQRRIDSLITHTASDTLLAGRRRSVSIIPLRLTSDSAQFLVTYGTSSSASCSWIHSTLSYYYEFVRHGKRWRYTGYETAIFGDPAPPPPSGAGTTCYGRGEIP